MTREYEDEEYAITNPYHIDYKPVKYKHSGRRVEVRTKPKVRRNALCSCGSGIKTKNCNC